MARKHYTYDGRLVLITGGSSGIGLALAKLLLEEGARVWILARHDEGLQKALGVLASVNGSKPGIIAADVSSWKQVQSAMEQFQGEVGVPDLLINSAGIAHCGYVQETPVDIFREMMDVDYFGVVHMVKAFLPGMIKRGTGQIVNVSSGAGYVGLFGYTAYGAAKFAVRGFSDVLRAEVKPLGIQVSVVFPPDTDTPQLAYENRMKPFETREITGHGGMLSPERVAREILDDVRRGRYVILPGLENKFYYTLFGLLGNAVYPIMDMGVADARRKKNKA